MKLKYATSFKKPCQALKKDLGKKTTCKALQYPHHGGREAILLPLKE
jgi:hypothetical protein